MENEHTTFGRYELVKQIGRGGMAEIFLALERGIEGMERQVALKRILPHMIEAEDFVSMFMDEARIAARLTHPNITHIYNFGEVDGVYFLAMEYIEGLTCSRLIRLARPEPIPVAIGLRVAADVCAALHYAHEMRDRDGKPLGLVHRDVSPQNVMLSNAGVAKLLDFGVARAATQSHATKIGQVKGKIGYIAPEVFQGKPLDRRADVFSAGALLFELISGVKLFKREIEAATVAAILNDDPPPLAGLKGVPPGVDPIIRKAVEKDVAQRYATAYEMQLDLEQLIALSGQMATPFVVGRFVGAMMERAAEQDRAAALAAAERAGLDHAATEHDLPPSLGSSEQSDSKSPKLDDLLRQVIAADPVAERDEAPTEISKPGTAPDLAPAGLAAPPTVEEAQEPDTDRSPPSDSPPSSSETAGLAAVHTERDAIAQRRTTAALVVAAAVGLAAILVAVGLIFAVDTSEPPPAGGPQPPPVARPVPPPPLPLVPGPTKVDPAPDAASFEAAQPADAGPAAPAHEERDAGPPGKALTGEPRPQPAAMGKLYLHTSPWSKVRVNGRSLGTTPIVGASLPAGTHTLHLEDAAGRRHTRQVTIRPGAPTKAFFDLN